MPTSETDDSKGYSIEARYLLDTGIMGEFINRRRGVAGHVDEARTRGDRVGTCWPEAASRCQAWFLFFHSWRWLRGGGSLGANDSATSYTSF